MASKSSYFLYGYFGTGNFGDEILLYAAIKNILKVDPAATFLIRNYGPVNLEDDFPGIVKCTDIEKIHYTSQSSFVKFLALIRSYWIYMGQVSTLVVGGGTLIHDSPNLRSTFLLLCLCLIAKIRGCRVLGIGLGVQKLETTRCKLMVRLMAKLFDRICLRDQRSYDQFKTLSGGSSRIVLTSDLAYALPAGDTSEHKGKVIAVTLADYLLKRLDPSSRQHALGSLAKVLTYFINKGFQIRLLSLQKEVTDLGVTGDSPLLENLLAEIPSARRQSVQMITIEADPNSIDNAYDGVCLTIGMRFHSLIFSAIKHIPFIGMAEEPKIAAICSEFSMPCFAANRWDDEALPQAISESMEKTIDPMVMESYRKLALNNFRLIEQ